MRCSIREMKKADWKEVAEIYRQGIESGIATFQDSLPTWEEWDKSHIKECRFVAASEEKILGWVSLSPTSLRECYRGVAEVSIYIDSNYKGLGIGKKLLSKVIEESEKHGFWTLQSLIISKNEGSIELHKKSGFRILGIRERVAKMNNKEWMDVIIMERRSKLEIFS